MLPLLGRLALYAADTVSSYSPTQRRQVQTFQFQVLFARLRMSRRWGSMRCSCSGGGPNQSRTRAQRRLYKTPGSLRRADNLSVASVRDEGPKEWWLVQEVPAEYPHNSKTEGRLQERSSVSLPLGDERIGPLVFRCGCPKRIRVARWQGAKGACFSTFASAPLKQLVFEEVLDCIVHSECPFRLWTTC